VVASTDSNGTVVGSRMFTPDGVTVNSTGTNTTIGFGGMDTTMVPRLLSFFGVQYDPKTDSLIDPGNPSCIFTDESLAPDAECAAGGGGGEEEEPPSSGCDGGEACPHPKGVDAKNIRTAIDEMPPDFERDYNVKIHRRAVRSDYWRSELPRIYKYGTWQKYDMDGYVHGEEYSVHYFETSATGWVVDVKLKPYWSPY
jgi:hypothetical protein